MKVICFVNQKGGVGKSTTCVNVGAYLAQKGYKVLLIDLESQGAISIMTGLRGQIEADDLTSLEVLKGAPIKDAARYISDNFYIVPADLRLTGAEIELAAVKGRDYLLKDALEPYSEIFDYVCIDCAQSLGILNLIALTASNEIVIPLKADYLSLNGMSQLIETIKVVRSRTNPELSILGIVATIYNSRRNLDKQTIEQVEKYFPGLLFETKIRQNTAIAEAPAKGTNIFEYAPRSAGAKQYAELTEEIIKRG